VQRGGLASYFARRARRILPPYYAALLLSLLLIAGIPALQGPVSFEWTATQPALTWPAVVSHLLLVHNLFSATALKINSPLWTIATEWQLYFVFPLVLLPLWRRAGAVVTIVAALAVSLGFVAIFDRGTGAAPWFAGLFAMGMAAAARSSTTLTRSDLRFYGSAAVLIGAVYAAATAVLFIFVSHDQGGVGSHFRLFWAFDIAVGLGVACGLVFCAGAAEASAVVRLFSSRPLVWLGVISYSLYLIHDPFLALLRVGLAQLQLNPFAEFATLVATGVPVVLLVAYVFHLCVERPFLSRRAKRRLEMEQSAPRAKTDAGIAYQPAGTRAGEEVERQAARVTSRDTSVGGPRC
jgi:peptidoglycan/LPS O-acetylase OafA/YrhL